MTHLSATPTAATTALHALAPEISGRVGLILDNLKALIAARFLKIPFLLPLLMPLWKRLNRIQRRLRRAMELHGVVRKPQASRAARPEQAPAPVRVRDNAEVCLPRRFGWLIAALGWEAAGYGSQLQYLLEQPDVAAVLAACSGARKVLRPVAHMLRFRVAEPVEQVPAGEVPAGEMPVHFPVPGAANVASDALADVVPSRSGSAF